MPNDKTPKWKKWLIFLGISVIAITVVLNLLGVEKLSFEDKKNNEAGIIKETPQPRQSQIPSKQPPKQLKPQSPPRLLSGIVNIPAGAGEKYQSEIFLFDGDKIWLKSESKTLAKFWSDSRGRGVEIPRSGTRRPAIGDLRLSFLKQSIPTRVSYVIYPKK